MKVRLYFYVISVIGLALTGCQTTQTYKTTITRPDSANVDWASYADDTLCTSVNLYGQLEAKHEAKKRNLNCMFNKLNGSGTVKNLAGLRLISDDQLCASYRKGKVQTQEEVIRRGLSCEEDVIKFAGTTPPKPSSTITAASATSSAAQRKAERLEA